MEIITNDSRWLGSSQARVGQVQIDLAAGQLIMYYRKQLATPSRGQFESHDLEELCHDLIQLDQPESKVS